MSFVVRRSLNNGIMPGRLPSSLKCVAYSSEWIVFLRSIAPKAIPLTLTYRHIDGYGRCICLSLAEIVRHLFTQWTWTAINQTASYCFRHCYKWIYLIYLRLLVPEVAANQSRISKWDNIIWSFARNTCKIWPMKESQTHNTITTYWHIRRDVFES